MSSLVDNPTQENPTTSIEDLQKKIKLGEGEVVAKFQTLQVKKSMVEALEVQLQLGKEKLETMIVEFHKVSIATTKVEEKVALKVADKLRRTFYNKNLEKGALKAIRTIEQMHPAF